MKRRVRILIFSILSMGLAVAVVSCGANAGLSDAIFETVTPMSASVRGTITARAAQAGDNGSLATAIVRATEEAQNVFGTETAINDTNSPAHLATATAIAPVVAELPSYGIDPADGYVAWLHPPVTISLQGFQQTGYANDFPNVTAENFVLAADITWHTFDSASGCGFMFRSNGDKNQPSQYMVIISRMASGQMAFLAMVDGKVANYNSFFPKDKDKSFNWQQDSTNRLGVVARGNILDLYTNDELAGEVDVTQPPSQSLSVPPTPELPAGANTSQVQDFQNQVSQTTNGLDTISGQLAQAKSNFSPSTAVLPEGFLGFVGLSQSGSMTCKFSNAWLFNLVK